MRKRHIALAAATLSVGLLGVARQAYATSYASQLTVSGSNVSFDLNEAAADVKLILNNGTSTVDLGAEAVGGKINTTVTGSPTLVQVEVTTNDGNGYLNLGSTTYSNGVPGSTALKIDPPDVAGNPIITGGSPSGLAIDTHIGSATFGTVYLANYASNTNANIPQVGVYVLNPDLTFQGASATETAPLTNFGTASGMVFAASGNTSPWRLSVGGDGYLYVGDWSSSNGGIDRAQLSATQGLVPATGTTVLAGIGNAVTAGENHSDIVSSVLVSGSTAAGNLQVIAIDTHNGSNVSGSATTDYQQLYQWNVGSTTGYAGAPTPLVNPTALGMDTRYWQPQPIANEWWFNDVVNVNFDLAQGGPANQIYVFQSRSTGAQPDLFVVSPNDNKTVVWDSLDETMRLGLPNAAVPTDYLLGDYSGEVSPDGRFLMEGQTSGASFKYGAYIIPLLAGIPDVKLSSPFQAAPSGSVRQSAFDPAGNIYSVNATTVQLNGFAPGGTDVTVTGSNGTFTATGQWNADANGNLSDTSKWLVGNIPNGSDQVLTFGAVTSVQRTVTVNSSETVGALVFNSPKGYTLSSGGGSISMTGLGVNFTANAGANTIAAPVTINSDTGLFAAAGASLTISGPITYANVTAYSSTARPDVVKGGAGTVSVGNLNLVQNDLNDLSSGNLDIYNGKLALLPNSGPAVVSELSVFTNQGASLDLANNSLIDDYGIITYSQTVAAGGTPTYTTTSPLAVIQGLVKTGGIFSSTAATSKGTTLAVAENGSLSTPFNSFAGQTVNTSVGTTAGTYGTVLVKYTYYGDLNLDGTVTGADLALFNDGVAGWTGGDLNYDGVVNADDFALFQLGAAAYGAGHVQLPEPASVALLGLAAIPMIRRRKA